MEKVFKRLIFRIFSEERTFHEKMKLKPQKLLFYERKSMIEAIQKAKYLRTYMPRKN